MYNTFKYLYTVYIFFFKEKKQQLIEYFIYYLIKFLIYFLKNIIKIESARVRGSNKDVRDVLLADS